MHSDINLMRFLHLFSMAGVAEIMCKYGAGDKVLQLESLDPFGFDKFYGVTETFTDINKLVQRAEELEPEYDKIVIHDFEEFSFHFTPSKVIYVFHGSKLRGLPQNRIDEVKDKLCFVMTTDLLDFLPNAIYLPQPVDLEHFKFQESNEAGESWLCINRDYERYKIEPKIKARYPKVEYYARSKPNIIQYEDMPDFLAQYTDYVDWKFDYSKPEPKSLPDPSCTGVQALSVGCRVWDRNGNVLSPIIVSIHDGKRVVERFMKEIK